MKTYSTAADIPVTDARADRVLPGIWRLRLPMTMPYVPSANVWLVADKGHVTLFDSGLHEEGSLDRLEYALAQAGHKLEEVNLLVCTHAHIDHYGQAAAIVRRSGCELVLHPDYSHLIDAALDFPQELERRRQLGFRAGVPAEQIDRYVEERVSGTQLVSGVVHPDRTVTTGSILSTAVGEWEVIATPGHAASHLCFFQPQQRLLICGDHLLGTPVLFFDFGFSPDPVKDYRDSLDRITGLDVRLCLPGHGRTFLDFPAHLDAHKIHLEKRLQGIYDACHQQPKTAFELMPIVYGEDPSQRIPGRLLAKILAYMNHLERQGKLQKVSSGFPEYWSSGEQSVIKE